MNNIFECRKHINFTKCRIIFYFVLSIQYFVCALYCQRLVWLSCVLLVKVNSAKKISPTIKEMKSRKNFTLFRCYTCPRGYRCYSNRSVRKNTQKILHELNKLTRIKFFMSNKQRLHHNDALLCVCFIAKLHTALRIIFISVNNFKAVISQRHLTNSEIISLDPINLKKAS